jgi:alanine or glycine:cation symporter, AGCS family
MKTFAATATVLTFSAFSAAAQTHSGIDEKINEWVSPATQAISRVIFYAPQIGSASVPLIVVWLIAGAAFFTLYFRFINFRAFRHAVSVTQGDYDNTADHGEVSHFQALSAALSGTLGLGNISGVAVAISLGGPGATFWMIIAGLLGMTSKFAECTLGLKYRKVSQNGEVSGGPMYYLSKGFADRNWPLTGKFLAVFFALMTVGGSIGGGNMFQGNQAAQQILNITGHHGTFFTSKTFAGILMALFVGVVIIGGIKSIARVTERIVPLMCGIYSIAALVIIAKFYEQIPDAFLKIFTGAFSPQAAYGGIVAVMVQGFQRASFSNEAGIGSASIAHSAAKTNEPVSEGLVSLLEPFIDTVVICTITALVTVISGEYLNPASSGITQTSAAFAKVLPWFPYILSVAVTLFAVATMISWSYYGLKAWTYMFGCSRLADLSFKLLFVIFIVIGAAMDMEAVIGFSDGMIFAMSIPNLIGLYVMAPEVKADLNSYMEKLKNGTIRKYS